MKNGAPPAAELTEVDVLIAVATAQGVLVEAARQILARDKHDGIRAVGWMKAHSDVLSKISSDYMMECGGSEEVEIRALKLAQDY